MKFTNNTFVITGSGNGIGRQLVLNLLARGARVAAVDVYHDGLDETAQMAGGDSSRLSIHIVDITERDAVSVLPEDVIKAHGVVDGLINNAGVIQPFTGIQEMDTGTIKRVMEINFFGTLHMTMSFLPYLRERPEACIVNISSMGGFLPVPGQGIYGASKSATKLFTEALFAELLKTNIQVSVVFPGGVRTEIVDQLGIDSRALKSLAGIGAFLNPMSPEKAAKRFIKGVEKGRFQIYVGIDAIFMSVLNRLNSKLAIKLITKQMGPLLDV